MRKHVLTQKEVKTLTLEQAKGLQRGTTLHHTLYRNADGTSMRARVTSVKTWKTRPAEVLVTAKYGFHSTYYTISEYTLDYWSTEPKWSFQEVPQTTETPNG